MSSRRESNRDSPKPRDKDKEKGKDKLQGTRGAQGEGMSSKMKEAMQSVKARPIDYDDEREYTRFFEKQVYPVLHRMKLDLIDQQPREAFCVEWIEKEKRGDNRNRVSRHTKQAAKDYENRGLGRKSSSPSQSRSPDKNASKGGDSSSKRDQPKGGDNRDKDKNKSGALPSSDESDDREESEVSERLAKRKENSKEVKRAGVSAESYGMHNKKADFKPVVIPKEKKQRKRILEKINQNIFLKGLSDEDKEIIIDAMKEIKKKKGEVVIKQGDPGEEFFVIDEGEIECHRVFKKGEAPKYLKTYEAGEGFGELALLYNAPRAATLTCKAACTLLVLDRQTFNHVIRESTVKKRSRYEETIDKIELLNVLEKYEKQSMIDSLNEEKFKKGETVVKEGDKGSKMFFIEKGEAKAYKMDGNKEKEVMQYAKGDYFGELALLDAEKGTRKATVKAETDLLLMSIDKDGFNRIFGPLQEILKRNMAKYQKFVKS